MTEKKKSQLNEKITVDEARAALLRSGYMLEQRVETLLNERGWYAEANWIFQDSSTMKARELDIHAMRLKMINKRNRDWLWAILLIECVNNPQPFVFLAKQSHSHYLGLSSIRTCGVPSKIAIEDKWVSVAEFLKMDKFHHYCSETIATQFCSFARKKQPPQEWYALHEDDHFDSFRKLIAVIESKIAEVRRIWKYKPPEPINLQFVYPALVLQGELFAAVTNEDEVKLLPVEHIQFCQSSITEGEQESYQIDVVTERYFAKYCELVEEEFAKTIRSVRKHRKVLLVSARKIAELARDKTGKELADALESTADLL